MALQDVRMNFERAMLPTFFGQLLDNLEQFQIGGRILFESVQLNTDDGGILHIFDGDLMKFVNGGYSLTLILVNNKMDKKNWFQIWMNVDCSKKYIEFLQFKHWEVQVKIN